MPVPNGYSVTIGFQSIQEDTITYVDRWVEVKEFKSPELALEWASKFIQGKQFVESIVIRKNFL